MWSIKKCNEKLHMELPFIRVKDWKPVFHFQRNHRYLLVDRIESKICLVTFMGCENQTNCEPMIVNETFVEYEFEKIDKEEYYYVSEEELNKNVFLHDFTYVDVDYFYK